MASLFAPFYIPIIRDSLKVGDVQPVEKQADSFDESTHQNQVIPLFQPEWENEFQQTDFQPRPILATCSVAALFYTASFFYGYFKPAHLRSAGGNNDWIALTWVPHLFTGVLSGIIACLIYHGSFRKFFVRYYNSVCIFLIVLFYTSTVWFNLIREIRRSKFESSNTPQIVWGIDFSSPLPIRTCNDTDPVGTWQSWPLVGTAVGCNNLILSGNVFAFYALINILPAFFRVRPLTAVLTTVANSLVLVAAVLAVGTRSWVLFTATLFQLAAGLSAAYMCRIRRQLARGQFAIAMGTRNAARKNRELLHTLIPENVLGRLASHEGGAMLGTTIRECTIMFCSLEPQAELQAGGFSEELFDFLHAVFSAFDEAVGHFGMFKYQHVVSRDPPAQ
jgi:hypothetical protein